MSDAMAHNALVVSDPLQLYIAQVNRFALLSREEEQELALLYRDTRDPVAAHKLVCGNLRFVVKIAHEYRHYGFKLLDLIQEGNIGLMQAVKKFDPRKGYRLISYAVWWIRAYIQNYILKMWSLVKIGTTQAQRKLFYNLRKLSGKMESRDGKVDHDHIARTLEVKQGELMEMEMRLAQRDFSLDAPVGQDGETAYVDLLTEGSQNQEAALVSREREDHLRHAVGRVLHQLNERERFIVQHRMMADDPVTLQDIGDRFRISRERARQIEDGIKKKLRRSLAQEGVAGSSSFQADPAFSAPSNEASASG